MKQCDPPCPVELCLELSKAGMCSLPEDPSGCIACGAIAGCCDKYPNCPGNPEWKPSSDPTPAEPK